VARAGHETGIPVFYYVLPQVWAWRRYRIHSLRRWADTLLAALPFEEKFYASYGVTVKFVGHPMLDEVEVPRDVPALKAELLPPGATRLIGLMPGSRAGEVRDMAGPLVAAADLIRKKIPTAGFVIPVAPHIPPDAIACAVGGRDYIKVVAGRAQDVMAASDLLITKSGTSTLEAALFGVPMIIVYRGSHLSYLFAKLLVKVPFAGLPNIIAGREVAKELLQGRFTPENVAAQALSMLEDPAALEAARKDMADVRARIGEKGAAQRAAAIIVERMKILNPKIIGGPTEPGYF
jgi:lipid-A-disaccharide synthase